MKVIFFFFWNLYWFYLLLVVSCEICVQLIFFFFLGASIFESNHANSWPKFLLPSLSVDFYRWFFCSKNCNLFRMFLIATYSKCASLVFWFFSIMFFFIIIIDIRLNWSFWGMGSPLLGFAPLSRLQSVLDCPLKWNIVDCFMVYFVKFVCKSNYIYITDLVVYILSLLLKFWRT